MLFLYLSIVNIHGGMLFLGGLDSLVGIAVLYDLKSSEFEFRSKRVFPHPSKEFSRRKEVSCTMGTWSFLGLNSLSVVLIIHHLLKYGLKMRLSNNFPTALCPRKHVIE